VSAAANPPVDVLIVGAGASGAALAWSLADTRMRIVCLEQGDWPKSTDYPSHGRDWEARQFGDWSIDPNRRRAAADYPVNGTDSPITVVNFNGVGGGTVLYAGHFPRLHPSDFRVRSLDGVADDWPIDYRTLEPFFAENDRIIGVAGLAGDPAMPEHQPPLPPVPMGKTGTAYGKAMNKLGWHWWPSDSAIATQDYEGREACANLGPCHTGWAKGAKSSADVTYWPMARRAGVELRTRCRVREILVDDNDMATGVVYYDADGVERRQRAEVVIVACNGVGTPRLLGGHILPNITAPVIVQVTLALSWAILTEAALSFVGLGTQLPEPSWGNMLNESRRLLEFNPWMAVFPGLAIMLGVLGFNLLGDALRDLFDPRLRGTR